MKTYYFIKAIREILSLCYYKNYAACSGAVHNIACHEDAIADVLIKHRFKKFKKPSGIKRDEALKWINNPELASGILPNGIFIEQPFGKQQSPDFIIKVNAKAIIFLEAKSSTDTKPLYNSGGINSDFLYVFCSKKTNATTIYMGSSIMTPEQQRLIDEHDKDAKRRAEVLNAKLREIDSNHRGISYYARGAKEQKYGKSYTDYFNHPDREKSEQAVFSWLYTLN